MFAVQASRSLLDKVSGANIFVENSERRVPQLAHRAFGAVIENRDVRPTD